MSGASLRANACVLVLAIVLLAIVGNWQPTLAGLWRLPGTLLLLGLAYESWIASKTHLAAVLRPPENFHLGRGADIQLVVSHALRRTLAVEIAPGVPQFFDIESSIEAMRINAGGRAVIERRVVPKRLGRFSWPPLRARVGGALGLAWWPKRAACEGEVRVLPDLFRSAGEVKSMAALGPQAGLASGAGAEVLRLRDYRAGDPPRVIDWKATARVDRLISREFVQDEGLQIILVLDVGRSSALQAGSLDRFGHYVNIAARLAQFAAQRDDSVGLAVYADRLLTALPPARGARAVARLRTILANSRVEYAESDALHAAMRVRAMARHRSLIVFLTDIDDTTAESSLAQAVRYLLPKHLPFIAGLSSAEAERMAHAPAQTGLDAYRSLAAQEYCIRLERKARALKALGAPALVAKPEQLERAVFAAYANFRHRRSA
jgi:uncharacterized protein (DUF58 family)